MTLSNAPVVGFVATTQPIRARQFYQNILGLQLVSDEDFALIFDSNGIMLRIQKVDKFTAQPFTVLGWSVSDLAACVGDLVAKGVEMLRVPGLVQDSLGIWDADERVS